jgi:hypothetical protein
VTNPIFTSSLTQGASRRPGFPRESWVVLLVASISRR